MSNLKLGSALQKTVKKQVKATATSKTAKKQTKTVQKLPASGKKSVAAATVKRKTASIALPKAAAQKTTKIDVADILTHQKSTSDHQSLKQDIKTALQSVRESENTKEKAHAVAFADKKNTAGNDKVKAEKASYTDKTSYLPVSNFKITSRFGVDRGDHKHSGIDLAVPEGSAVSAVKSGTVTFAGWSNGYGYRVVVDHGDGTQTTYSHLSDIGVEVGDKVSAGTEIALSGSTGHSTGPHLHFEVKVDGNYVDPESYFDFGDGITAVADSGYTSKMASSSQHQSSTSSTSTTTSSSSDLSHKISFPSGDDTPKYSYDAINQLFSQNQATHRYAKQERKNIDYFDETKNPLLALIPAYNSNGKNNRTKKTATTKRA
jgi:murein DD-endopeptidase MepM/ murein hydrolase activator NlpD